MSSSGQAVRHRLELPLVPVFWKTHGLVCAAGGDAVSGDVLPHTLLAASSRLWEVSETVDGFLGC